MFRSILTALLLTIASIASAANPSPKCFPGTTPNRYKITFNNGAIVILEQQSFNTWGNRDFEFSHCGSFAAYPGVGAFTNPRIHFRTVNTWDDGYSGFVSTTDIRDGAGPWTFPVKNIYGQTVSNVTIVGVP